MKTSRLLSLALAAGLPVSVADAAILTWASAVNGNAGTAARWSPAQVPTAADQLFFNVGGPTNSAYTVTYDFSCQNSSEMSVAEDLVTFNILNGHQTGALRVGIDGTLNPTLTITTGTLNCTGGVSIAFTSNSVGATVNVNDTDASLFAGASGDINIGDNGQGVLNVTNGGTAQAGDDVIIGRLAVSDGLATVAGSGLSDVSRLNATGVTGDLVVGLNGAGELRIGAFAIGSSSNDTFVGQNSTSTGLLSVFSGGRLDAGRNLHVGGNASGTAAGNGTFEIGAVGTATVNVVGTTSVGDAHGGSGQLIMNGGMLSTGSFAILAGGTLSHAGGTIIVNGGTFSNNATQLVVDSTTGSPILDLRGIQSNAFTNAGISVVVGATGSGELVLRSGRTLSGSTGSVVIGNAAAGNGAVTVESGSTLDTGNAFFFVGNSGDGVLTVTSGGRVNAANTTVATSVGASGSITVTGAGSTMTALDIILGGNQTTNANLGPASLTIADGAVVTASDDVMSFGNDDSLTISNATLNAQSVVLQTPGIGATLANLTNAVVHADLFRIVNGNATLSGLIDARFDVGAAISTLTLSGDLTAGDAASGAGFVVNGPVNVGPHNLVMLDSNNASPGSVVTLAGGSLRCDSGLVNFGGSSISGFGTIHSNVGNAGSITATGAGLTFNGILTGTGTGCSGTRFTFGPAGGFTGQGTIAAEVVAQSGSVITLTGPASFGNAASLNGFVSDGLIVVGSHSLTMLDNGAATINDATLNAGSLLCSSGNILMSGTVTGSGSLGGAGRLFINRVGSSRLEPNGTFTMLGAYTQANAAASGPGGALEINVTSASGFDRLAVAGNATLAGTLEGGLVPGGSLSIGDRITFLTAASVIGTFQTVNVPGFHAEYFANRVDLVFDGIPCDPDVNADGNIDQDDIDYLVAVVAGGSNPANADPDFNRDGNVDQDDVDALINVVAGGACP